MKMAATAAGNRSVPNNPGPNGGNLHSSPSSNAPNCGQQDSGAPMSSQETAPSSQPQQHFSTRPVFYVPAPPPPPFLPFQWPMPFSYNPFGGFPGYGMVMPPFAPPPYVDSYILPHPHLQPVDYRRLLHPQVPVPTVPYQNPNQARRIRLPYAAPVRATANSAVQTEPRHVGHYADRSPPIRSDSGHGTNTDSPSSSSTSSHKRASADNCSLTSNHANELQSPRTGNDGTDQHAGDATPHPVDVPSRIGMTVEIQKGCKAMVDREAAPPYKGSHCNVWSVGSSDSIVPVCSSSQQEDEVARERRVSFPDILMSWAGGTPPATSQRVPETSFHRNETLLPPYENVGEQENPVCKSPVATNCSVALENADAGDSGNVPHIQGLGNGPVEVGDSGRRSFPSKDLLPSLNSSNEPENEETLLTEMDSYQMLLSGCNGKRRINESVWSVESLPPFIPPKEPVLLKKTADSEVILEMTEGPEKDNSGDKCSPKAELQGASSSACDAASGSWLEFASPARRAASLSKRAEAEPEPATAGAEPKPGRALSPVETQPMVSLAPPPCDFAPTSEAVGGHRAPEPEANRSPKQGVAAENAEREEASPASVLGERLLQTGAEADVCVLTSQQSTVCVSPSKGHLVDCGIQCTRLLPYSQEEARRYQFKYSDWKNDSGGKAEGFFASGEMQRNKRNGSRKYRGRSHWQ